MRTEEDRSTLHEPSPSALQTEPSRGAAVVQLRRSREREEPPATGEPAGRWFRDIEALEAVIATWEERERNTVSALERAIDALHKEALARLIRSLKSDPSAALALKRAAADPLVYAVLRHHEIVRPSLQERVEAALQSVRPSLASHGGDVELVEVRAPDTVTVRLTGSCEGCSSAGLTMKAGVEKAIQEHCPEILHIEQAAGSLAAPPSVHHTSPFADPQDAGWLHAARLDDIRDGGILPVQLASRSLLLTRSGQSVSCFDNACAHLGMPLDRAETRDGVLTCPHHRFQFLLESGECLTVPEVQLLAHPTRVHGQEVQVRLS